MSTSPTGAAASDHLPCTGPHGCARRVVTLDAAPDDARRAVEQALRETHGWVIGRLAGPVDVRADGLRAAFAVAFGLFTDDIDVHIARDETAGAAARSVVTLRSASRIGRGDLGVNARRLGALVGALTAR